jgi:glycine reductase
MLSALPALALNVGALRVVRGIRIEHVCGDPSLSAEEDAQLGRTLVMTALRALQTPIQGPTLFDGQETQEVSHAS